MSEQVLTDFEVVQILNTDRPKTGWAYGLCREVEAKVVSRCRAQGGNTSDESVELIDSYLEAQGITQAAANKAEVEGIASSEIPEGWPTEIWLNAGDEDLAPFSEYDELSWCSLPQGENDIRYVREDLLDTPPATTGASTAPDGWEPVYLVWSDKNMVWQDDGMAEWEGAAECDRRIAYQPQEVK